MSEILGAVAVVLGLVIMYLSAVISDERKRKRARKQQERPTAIQNVSEGNYTKSELDARYGAYVQLAGRRYN